MVTGSPAMMRNSSMKSLALERQQLGQRARGGPRSSSAMIICAHRADALGVEEHVLGAAQPDALGAELARGLGVERRFGVGAHAHAGGTASAQSISVAKSPDSSGSTIGTAPTNTSPVAPSSVMISPACTVVPRGRQRLRVVVDARCSPAPATQGRPMPRATTAAWLVMPPRVVRMPLAACMPWMSSGLVSMRTRITASPFGGAALGLVGA